MNMFQKLFKSNKKDVDFLASTLSNKTKNLTRDEVKNAIVAEGYSKNIANKVINKFKNNSFRDDLTNKVKDSSKLKSDKEKLLKELSQSVKEQKKEDVKELKTEASQKSELKKVSKTKSSAKGKKANIFRKAYLYCEDKYYDLIEAVGVTKLTDKIDKKVPSFILFILLIIVILALLLTLVLPHQKEWTMGIHVIDSSGSDLSGVKLLLTAKDKNIISAQTDVFGDARLEQFKAKSKVDVKLRASKEKYLPSDVDFKLTKDNLNQKITLEINTNELLLMDDSLEKIRSISFVENGTLLVLSPLSVTFTCSKPNKTPSPSYKQVTSGKVIVTQVAGCGELRVNVVSDNYEQISNMIVPASDKINLTKVLTNTGQLTVKLKNISGNNISDGLIKVYSTDLSTTMIDESEFVLKTGNSDIYGKSVFDLTPGNYLASVDKIGYLFLPKQGPINISVKNNTDVEYTLFTAQNINEFDCSKPLYEPFCNNGEIDCNNPILLPYLTFNDDGTCVLGTVGYLDVTLKDANSGSPVNGDVTLWGKVKDTNAPYKDLGKTIDDTNHAVFDVLDTYVYKVFVTNTEVNGYLQPDPQDVNGIDKNIIILLEYSSELNSGTIGVNVTEQSNNISNARVYLYKKINSGDVLINPTPKLTNIQGDVNFPIMRSGYKYFAYAIHTIDNLEGTSLEKKLDANEFLQLDVSLTNTPRILNLKVTPSNYDINFYSPTHELITDFVVNPVDQNKQYIFTTNNSQIYAVVKAGGYASYQTEIIKLYPGQEVFKEIQLITFASCSKAKLEFIGMYNQEGDIKVINIDYNNYTLADEYKLKFKYSACLASKDISYAHIRAGTKQIVDDDSIVLQGLYTTVEEATQKLGFAFQGELVDWNTTYYNQYYNLDHSYSWNEIGEKWIDIDFKDSDIDQIEFSVNFTFKGDISPIEDYKISYRALSFDNPNFYFDPQFTGANNWSIVPKGYFYAKTNKYQIPFANTDYILTWKLKDASGTELTMNGNSYPLNINTNYLYDLKFLHLKSINKFGIVENTSQYTNNNLIYNSYIFKDRYNNIVQDPNNNDTNFKINDVNSNRGYYFDLNSVLHASSFFEIGSSVNPKIKTNIIAPFARLDIPVYAYISGADYLVEINTSDSSGNNYIYAGTNDVNFFVHSNMGVPLSGVGVKYSFAADPGFEYVLGETNANGALLDKNVVVPINLVGSNINFMFTFDANYGFNNSQLVINKEIKSGYFIIPGTPLNYTANVISIEGINNVMIDTSDYNVVKRTDLVPVLQTVNIRSSSGIIDVDSTDAWVTSANDLPNKQLYTENTNIFAPIVLDSNNINGSLSELAAFENDLLIGDNNGIPIVQLLDQNVLININYFGDITTFTPVIGPGIYVDNNGDTHVELIKDEINSKDLVYNLVKSSASPLIMKINNVVASGTSDINLEYMNEALLAYSGTEITDTGISITIPYLLTSSSTTGKSKEVNLDFNIQVGSDLFIIHTKVTYLDVFDKDTIVIEKIIKKPIIDCKESICKSDVVYNLKNDTKSYSISLMQFTDVNDSNIPLEISTTFNLPKFVDNTDLNFTVISNYEFFSIFNYYFASNNNPLKLNFAYLIDGTQINATNNLMMSIVVYKELPLPSNYGVQENICVGVGGQIDGQTTPPDNVFILASCDEQLDCESGEGAVPKVLYYWGKSNTDISWSGTEDKMSCISDNSEYDTTKKFYCDSSQMLLSVINRVNNTNCDKTNYPNCETNYYIYLMEDGVSTDLLSDFINDNKFTSGIDNTAVITYITNLFNDGKFTIFKNKTEPGMYKVTVTNINNVKLDINLELLKSLPASQRSIFYYLPIDGTLGYVDGDRVGYGTAVDYQEPTGNLIPFYLDTEQIYLIDSNSNSSPINISAINYANEEINSPYFQRLQETDGKLFSLSLQGAANGLKALDLTFSPTVPVPVYSRIGCPEKNSFNYAIKDSSNNTLPVLFSPLISWDYNVVGNEGKIDDIRMIDTTGYYKNHQINLKGYVGIEDVNYTLLKTMIYLPIAENLDGYKLSTVDFTNSKNTVLYNKADNAEGEEVSLISNIARGSIVSVEDLFTQIENGNACIYNGASSTYIKWVSEKIDASPSRINAIIEDAKKYTDSCGQGNAQIE